MKVFRVWTDEYWYDEYSSCVVIAGSEMEARAIVEAESEMYTWEREPSVKFEKYQLSHLVVEEIPMDKPKLVDSSFNAG